MICRVLGTNFFLQNASEKLCQVWNMRKLFFSTSIKFTLSCVKNRLLTILYNWMIKKLNLINFFLLATTLSHIYKNWQWIYFINKHVSKISQLVGLSTRIIHRISPDLKSFITSGECSKRRKILSFSLSVIVDSDSLEPTSRT